MADPWPHTIETGSESTIRVDVDEVDQSDAELSFRCSSGDRFGGTYRGPPLAALMSHAEVPADTTHLVLRSKEDTSVCIPLADSLAGLLDLDGEPVSGAPRFVALAIIGTRTLKSVVSIEHVYLEPGESREYHEIIIEHQNERRD